MNHYLLASLLAFILSAALTPLIKQLAWHWHIVDRPDQVRKLQTKPVALLGGWAIFIAASLVMWLFRDYLIAGDLTGRHWLGVWIGGLILMIGGTLDDLYNLRPSAQLVFSILAVLAVIIGGVGINKVTGLNGELIFLNKWQISLFTWQGITRHFVVLADLFTLTWLMALMYTTKLLDGLDGLVTGLIGIGSIIIALFTLTTKYYQPDIALASLIFAAACAGFLLYNWSPAKIYLGDGGSLLLGYFLGVLAIISGGKIAIALLIMGIPMLDVAWVIVRRLLNGENPFKSADRGHLHYRLLDLGWGVRRSVLAYYLIALVFGVSALFLQSRGKRLALLLLFLVMAIVVVYFSRLDKARKRP
ncbi:undecaprenyl/decaprenyl-phosphate alpha-N-acetylglucosaminyl 1-phosphate transferase [Patescibacteria group bacterium]|nr:undecaprenyl/decaprenyl-phosphate alpha-N-acetylglucosaminyl 1-phosphate transferase [Patescibacteria group bacterium]HPD07778.1 MraY family glycosyltransferase [bacterium]HRT11104.1 MraY family glycosyltransferase [Patescibacteria group bacterium]HRU89939.1 MraY family glycosyltransferase [Patescibacteria group bacterium]